MSSSRLPGAGRRRRTRTSSTTTRSRRAGTSPPGSSRNCTPRSSATGSDRCADRFLRAARTNTVRAAGGHPEPHLPTTEVLMSTTVQAATDIRPFHVEIPEQQTDELRRRIAATRWPSKELVDDRSQGVQLATLKELARYWASDYDFGRVQERLNALPQFTTEIDRVEIHFIHVRSPHE